MHKISWTNFGDRQTPQEIQRLRRQHMDAVRRLGQPVVVRHMYNRDDVAANEAKQCPACYVPGYDQPKNDCPVCFGIGFVSVENDSNANLYIDTNGEIVTGNPGTNVRAPRFGGFAAPYLTWMIQPDVTEDTFKINEEGALIRTYDGQGIAPWYPQLGDNDLCINVVLESDQFTIASTEDRFQLKRVQQVTVRGFGVRTRNRAGAHIYLCQQMFEMNKVPSNSILYDVPVDVSADPPLHQPLAPSLTLAPSQSLLPQG